MEEKIKCLLCGGEFPVAEMRPMVASSKDWVCKDYMECQNRQKEKR